MTDDKTRDELKLAAGWNPPEDGPEPPAGLAWRAEPPDRPGWWIYIDGPGMGGGCYSAAEVEMLAVPQPESSARWLAIPDPFAAAPDPADLVVTAVGPDEALAVAAEALRAAGEGLAARVVEKVAAAVARGDRSRLACAEGDLVDNGVRP